MYQPLAAVQHLLNVRQQAAAVGAAGHQVGLHHGGRLLGEGLGIAAGEHRHGAGVLALGPAEPLAALPVTAGGHGTAVHNVDVGGLVRPGQSVAVLAQQVLQCTGFVLVYLTAKGIKTYTHSFSQFNQSKSQMRRGGAYGRIRHGHIKSVYSISARHSLRKGAMGHGNGIFLPEHRAARRMSGYSARRAHTVVTAVRLRRKRRQRRA